MQEALNSHEGMEFRVTTSHFPGSADPVGFYSMAVRWQSVSELSPGKGKGKGRIAKGMFPAVLLSQLGVHEPHHGSGIGTVLMGYAIRDFYEIVVRTGIFAMVLQAKNRRLIDFYQKLGFVEYGFMGAVMPKMYLPAEAVIDMIEKRPPAAETP
jgi:GNAT superfamily N-acetyltransferase